MPRILSPEAAFKASITVARRDQSITKAEAENAIGQLAGAGSEAVAPQEKARIVKDFLASKGASALTPKARELLADFVKKQSTTKTGDSALAAKTKAGAETAEARENLEKAAARLERLLKAKPGAMKEGLTAVKSFLKGASADVGHAKAILGKIAKDGAAKIAAKDLGAAAKELAGAAKDLDKLIAKTKGAVSAVKKSDVESIQEWLLGPADQLKHAQDALAGGTGPIRTTKKFPSDNEDGGAVTEKFPSDAEDGGAGAGGGAGGTGPIRTTRKFPSDNEDGGGRPDPGGGAVTAKYPSDNEDGGGGGMYTTMKAPSDNEDHGGGTTRPDPGGIAVTAKYPSDAEDGGAGAGGGGGGVGGVTTEKYPSDNEDGGGGTDPDPGGIAVTAKYPSDNEDGGGRVGGGSGGAFTEKYPSDNDE